LKGARDKNLVGTMKKEFLKKRHKTPPDLERPAIGHALNTPVMLKDDELDVLIKID
jgi:hypothetical protein